MRSDGAYQAASTCCVSYGEPRYRCLGQMITGGYASHWQRWMVFQRIWLSVHTVVEAADVVVAEGDNGIGNSFVAVDCIIAVGAVVDIAARSYAPVPLSSVALVGGIGCMLPGHRHGCVFYCGWLPLHHTHQYEHCFEMGKGWW